MNYDTFFPDFLESLRLTAPMMVMILTAVAILIADVFMSNAQRWALPIIGLAGVALAIVTLQSPLVDWAGPGGDGVHAFFGMIRMNYLVFLSWNVILGMAIFILLISPRYLDHRAIPHGEYYALVMFAVLGMLALAASSELLTLFLNLEMLSITLYVLAGIEKNNIRSSEAGFKYFLLGSFAAAFMLMGIAFVFGATGQTSFSGILSVIQGGLILQPQFLATGFALMMVGFCFKLTLAPFHMYAPDVYEGSPTPVTAMIATGTKVAGFVVFFHFIQLIASWGEQPAGLWAGLYAVVLISMIVGNTGAIVQPNIKRMLAYSSIAHSAYVVIPMVVILKQPGLIGDANEAVAYYLLAYTLMTLLAFGAVSALGPMGESRIVHYAGLGRRSPALAVMLALALISLVGIPPTIGFFGKMRLFMVAVEGEHIWLAVLGVLSSVASAYYYLRVIVTMYMEEPSVEVSPRLFSIDGINFLAMAIGCVGLIAFAIFPWLYLFAF